MKKIIVFTIRILCVLSLVGCGSKATSNANTEQPYAGAPKIVLDGQDYFAAELVIMNELPEGYSYAGELTDEKKNLLILMGKSITFWMEWSLLKISMFIRSAEPQ